MTFTAHTDDVIRRCTGILIGLSHCRHALPHSTLTTLVQSLVTSLIRYCITVYGSCGASQYLGESGAGSPPLSLAGVILKLMELESLFLPV